KVIGFTPINWVHPLLGITTKELSPLFNILKGDPDLASPRSLTSTAQKSLQHVANKIQSTTAARCIEQLPIRLFVIYQEFQPYALIGQWNDALAKSLTAL
ncbi:POK18 protein, partial [Rynchops niger]|nr:POK18 protein [Rynchops niger]